MVDPNNFREGFEQGFRAVVGSARAMPAIPAQPATKAGMTPFQMGIRKGIKKGCERKDVTPADF
ncbi:hypothetical protein FVE89_13810 [Methylobacterium sp. 2A]|uniref:hypothetical protein n=1 Tax=Methylobacterium sp. 2A TaxID=2603816 RepID=UPI0013538B04|nr:hypothetical protein [Methylobacterium sp. 2A]MWV23051.1 hypothetical protein [Methylobacterium sp. 2A]